LTGENEFCPLTRQKRGDGYLKDGKRNAADPRLEKRNKSSVTAGKHNDAKQTVVNSKKAAIENSKSAKVRETAVNGVVLTDKVYKNSDIPFSQFQLIDTCGNSLGTQTLKDTLKSMGESQFIQLVQHSPKVSFD
jgi:hypothetical protein